MNSTSVSPLPMVAGEDLLPHRLVKMSGSTSRTVVYADSGDRPIGVTLARTVSGDPVAVEALNTGGTLKVTAAGTIAVNAVVYTANDGKVSDSVAGNALGILLSGGSAGVEAELLPYGMPGGAADTDLVVFSDDFFHLELDETGSEGDWLVDANDGGAVAITDAHAGVISITASDTTAGDNDETYLMSISEIFKPAAAAANGGIVAIAKARIKFTEANTDDANVVFALLGGDTTDLANTIADNGGMSQTFQQIGIFKADGGTVYQGMTYDSGLHSDTNIGARTSGSWTELKMVISDANITDGSLEVTFYVNGVAGGTLNYALASATEMRLVVGVKNGDTNAETLFVDKVRLEFAR